MTEPVWKKYLTDYNEGLGLVYERFVLNNFLLQIKGKYGFANVLEAQRVVESQCVADRARLPRGRDDGDRAECGQGVGQRVNTLRAHTVVVGDQDSWH